MADDAASANARRDARARRNERERQANERQAMERQKPKANLGKDEKESLAKGKQLQAKAMAKQAEQEKEELLLIMSKEKEKRAAAEAEVARAGRLKGAEKKFRADEAELLRARAERKRKAKEARRAEKRRVGNVDAKRAKIEARLAKTEALLAAATAALGIFDVLDADKSGTLSKDEIVAGAEQINLTPEEAAAMWDDLDRNKSGATQLSRSELEKKIERMEKERRDLDRTKPRSPEEEAERHEKSKAAAAAHKRAKHHELAQRVEALIATARAALGIFDVLDADKSGTLSKDEIVAGAKQINLTPEEAAAMWDALDRNKTGMTQLSTSELEMKIGRMEKELEGLRKDPEQAKAEMKAAAEEKAQAKSLMKQKGVAKTEALLSSARAALGLFDVLDADQSGTLSKDEIVAGASQIGLTAEEAASLWDDLDRNKSGATELKRSELQAKIDKLQVEIADLSAAAARAGKSKEEAEADRRAAKAAAKEAKRSDSVAKVEALRAAAAAALGIFDVLDEDKSDTLSRDEVVGGADLIGLTAAEAASLWDDLDRNKTGMPELNVWELRGKILKLDFEVDDLKGDLDALSEEELAEVDRLELEATMNGSSSKGSKPPGTAGSMTMEEETLVSEAMGGDGNDSLASMDAGEARVRLFAYSVGMGAASDVTHVDKIIAKFEGNEGQLVDTMEKR